MPKTRTVTQRRSRDRVPMSHTPASATLKHRDSQRPSKPRKRCEHGRERFRCRDCNGVSICEHNRQRYYCLQCTGTGICPHRQRKERCRLCGGAGLCAQHFRRIEDCRECNPDHPLHGMKSRLNLSKFENGLCHMFGRAPGAVVENQSCVPLLPPFRVKKVDMRVTVRYPDTGERKFYVEADGQHHWMNNVFYKKSQRIFSAEVGNTINQHCVRSMEIDRETERWCLAHHQTLFRVPHTLCQRMSSVVKYILELVQTQATRGAMVVYFDFEKTYNLIEGPSRVHGARRVPGIDCFGAYIRTASDFPGL